MSEWKQWREKSWRAWSARVKSEFSYSGVEIRVRGWSILPKVLWRGRKKWSSKGWSEMHRWRNFSLREEHMQREKWGVILRVRRSERRWMPSTQKWYRTSEVKRFLHDYSHRVLLVVWGCEYRSWRKYERSIQKTPTEINISAKFKTAKYFTAMKSITFP